MLTKKIKLNYMKSFKNLAFPLNLIEFLKKVGNGETLLSFKFKGCITTTQYLRGGRHTYIPTCVCSYAHKKRETY